MPLNLLTLTYLLNLTPLKGLMSGTKLHIHFSRSGTRVSQPIPMKNLFFLLNDLYSSIPILSKL